MADRSGKQVRARRKAESRSIWSPRSQKSVLRELALETALQKCRDQITFCERRITEQKDVAKQQTQTVTEGASFAIRQALSHTLEDIESRERELAAFREREKTLQAEISALTPSAHDADLRALDQASLATLVIERFSKDAAIDRLLQKVRRLLQERADMTGEMAKLATRLEFAESADFDGRRFAALLDSIPAELAGQSHDWVEEFLGQSSGKEPCVIGKSVAVLPETLASAGVFRPGETVYMTKAQIAQLPTDEGMKSLPGPEEMEAVAGNRLASLPQPTPQEDSIEVSGFLVK